MRNRILTLVAGTVVPLALAAPTNGFSLDWHTIDAGGGFSIGGYYELSGTIGQPDAGPAMSGGGYELTGGFWGCTTAADPQYDLGDLNCDGWVNNGDIDAFVFALSYPEQYPDEYPDCDVILGDINGDGWVNNGDIDGFVTLLAVSK